MVRYEEFFRPRRVMLADALGSLSAGLSPRVFLSACDPANVRNFDLITFTTPRYLMGGAFLWRRAGTRPHPATGSPVPFFKPGIPLKVESFYPVHGHPELSTAFTTGFFGVYKRESTEPPSFTFQEESSERFGIPLLEHGINAIPSCKIEIRDLNGDGLPDIIIGENNWGDYWPRVNVDGKSIAAHWGDAAYQPFDAEGHWRGGPLRGRVFFFQNLGEDPQNPAQYRFAPGVALEHIDQYGFCTPLFGDFTGDRQEDLITGNFIHDLTFFKRRGTAKGGIPQFDPGIPILDGSGKPRKLRGVINYCLGGDVTGHGRVDLLVSSENGYVTLLENLGELAPNGSPRFAEDVLLLQERPPLKADILAVPAIDPSVEHGLSPMVVGTGGGFFYAFDGINPAKFLQILNLPRILPPDPARGSIQGPSEIGWGYVAPVLFDWDADGRSDLIFSDINGEHQVCLNLGRGNTPRFAPPRKILDAATGHPLATVWRCRPALARDPNESVHYLCLDEDARLAHYVRTGDWSLQKRELVLTPAGHFITFTDKFGGARGRVRFQFFDWNQQGVLDVLLGLPGSHNFRQIPGNEKSPLFSWATGAILRWRGTWEKLTFDVPQYLLFKSTGAPLAFGHHACTPTAYLDGGEVHLLVGGEDGQIYHFLRREFT